MPRAHLVFDEVERLLGDKLYFAGDEVSLADILVALQVEFLTRTPE